MEVSLVSRSRTAQFKRYRCEGRRARGRAGGGPLASSSGWPGHSAASGHRLLDCEPAPSPAQAVVLELAALPPRWVDFADEAREGLGDLRARLARLQRAQQRRLLRVFDDGAGPEKEVQAISDEVGAAIRQCEGQMRKVEAWSAGEDPGGRGHEVRQQVHRGLLAQLQELVLQFRRAQKGYLRELRSRQQAGDCDERSTSASSGAAPLELGLEGRQELESTELDVAHRSAEICRIASSVSELHAIFKELALMVIDQGTVLDRIDYNIEQAGHQAGRAATVLRKTERAQRSQGSMKCILVLAAINMLLLLLLMLKIRR